MAEEAGCWCWGCAEEVVGSFARGDDVGAVEAVREGFEGCDGAGEVGGEEVLDGCCVWGSWWGGWHDCAGAADGAVEFGFAHWGDG